MVVNATRIYMTHVHAKKLADTFRNILESSDSGRPDGDVRVVGPKIVIFLVYIG